MLIYTYIHTCIRLYKLTKILRKQLLHFSVQMRPSGSSHAIGTRFRKERTRVRRSGPESLSRFISSPPPLLPSPFPKSLSRISGSLGLRLLFYDPSSPSSLSSPLPVCSLTLVRSQANFGGSTKNNRGNSFPSTMPRPTLPDKWFAQCRTPTMHIHMCILYIYIYLRYCSIRLFFGGRKSKPHASQALLLCFSILSSGNAILLLVQVSYVIVACDRYSYVCAE